MAWTVSFLLTVPVLEPYRAQQLFRGAAGCADTAGAVVLHPTVSPTLENWLPLGTRVANEKGGGWYSQEQLQARRSHRIGCEWHSLALQWVALCEPLFMHNSPRTHSGSCLTC